MAKKLLAGAGLVMVVAFLFVIAFGAHVAMAQTSITLPNPLSCNDLVCATGKVYTFIFDIAIPITAIMALVGGFQMITAGGDPEKFGKGRKTLLYAAIGFAVVLVSGGIVQIIQSFFQ